MKEIYTYEQWATDGTFKAEAGQEISAGVYENMFNCMPPEKLPRAKARQALQDYKIAIHAGFLMGEPHSTNKNGELLYMAFGSNDFGKGKKYFYLGLSVKAPELNGDYYFFDCLGLILNGDVTGLPDNYAPVGAFENDGDAIRAAANYEATLYRVTYQADELTGRTLLYDPWSGQD